SFDRALLQELGRNLGQAAKAERVGILLGPGINLKRSPLAGRNFEYFSEDPYLTGELASSYVQGVQESGVGVSLKHFDANNREDQRFTASSN
ncbi:glycoside hydrolase family 3 N-terminal domain-containing protein, partial [Oenococcus oeni]|uniref:glycoside hydrolase family 3 N-terminal domain-containing protein n=1 Tax=Oenococcus oeni TaxID=1247 RepID=UPI000ADD7702